MNDNTILNGIDVFAYYSPLSDKWILCSHNNGSAIMRGTKSEVTKEYRRLEEEGRKKRKGVTQ